MGIPFSIYFFEVGGIFVGVIGGQQGFDSDIAGAREIFGDAVGCFSGSIEILGDAVGCFSGSRAILGNAADVPGQRQESVCGNAAEFL